MKYLLLFGLILITFNLYGQNKPATTIKKTFNRTTEVAIVIDAPPEDVWTVLVDAKEFQNWNSTVVSLTGKFRKGEKIRLVSKLDPSRTFKLKIKELIPNEKMIWRDAMGERIYLLKSNESGQTIFTMIEKIGGFMFPLFANKIPSFDDSFDQFAQDLKRASEI